MILSLYLETICFCAYVVLTQEGLIDLGLIVGLLGIVFFWIAQACYDRTITKFKNEIRELRNEIRCIKETDD